ncbi:hypothetical protein M8494_02995 [Serratia ureilytica]
MEQLKNSDRPVERKPTPSTEGLPPTGPAGRSGVPLAAQIRDAMAVEKLAEGIRLSLSTSRSWKTCWPLNCKSGLEFRYVFS